MADDCLIRQNPIARDDLLREALISPARLCAFEDPVRLPRDLSDCLQPLVGFACEVKAMVMETQTEKLKKQEKERDFFCVARDALRVLPVIPQSLSGAPGLLLEPCLSFLSGFSPDQCFIFPIPGIGDQHCDHDRHLPHGVSYPEHAKPRC
jgi:hypothetical protein